MTEITLEWIEKERIAITWSHGKPQVARYLPYTLVVWYVGDTIRDCVQALLDDEERRANDH